MKSTGVRQTCRLRELHRMLHRQVMVQVNEHIRSEMRTNPIVCCILEECYPATRIERSTKRHDISEDNIRPHPDYQKRAPYNMCIVCDTTCVNVGS